MSAAARKRLRREYTGLLKRYDQFNRPVYKAVLNVGSQRFGVCDASTRKRAEWFRDQLTTAIETLLKKEQNP